MAAERTDEFARERSGGRGAKYWRDVFARWERSGLTQAEFCRRRGVSITRFRWWRYDLKRRSGVGDGDAVVGRRGRRSRKARFVAVHVREPKRLDPEGRIELVLKGGRVLRIGCGFDRELLVEVVQVLESGAC